jgi:hypothetical protein
MNPQETGFLFPQGAIVNQIQTLLDERYKEGFPIIKEILQNANDGGATRLDIGITPGIGDNTSVHPQLKGPALFFVNNGGFRDSDSQAIGWIGVDFNAGNSAKIGKFGLGQKSVFHFCESFFYAAHSTNLSENSTSFRFLTPWADGEPMTTQDKLAIESYLRDFFLQENEYSEYFILWLPLRTSNQPRSILSNIYNHNTIQDHLPQDMAERIGKLLPLLNSLQSVYYWIPEEDNRLKKSFNIKLTSEDQRFSYPKPEENFSEDNFANNLSGSVEISDSLTIYGGVEATLSEINFQQLIPENPREIASFWSTLRSSANWPKRSTYDNQTAEPIVVPDKSIPHCGVVVSRQRIKKNEEKGKLIIQWAVFLPLEEETNNLSYEQIPIDAVSQYTLTLHGYFFLDSGRRSIEGLSELYAGQLNQRHPKNQAEMIKFWNLTLATEGVLPRILLALENFSENPEVNDDEIRLICLGLQRSKLFKQQALHKYLYKFGYWVYQVRPKNSQWQHISLQHRLLALPRIPNWSIWFELVDPAANSCLILESNPNLIPQGKPDKWSDDEIIRILKSLNIIQVFNNLREIAFWADWLEIIVAQNSGKQFPTDVQDCLQKQLKKILTESNTQDVEQARQASLTSVIRKLNQSRWFFLDCDDVDLFQYLNQILENILLIPRQLSPSHEQQTLSKHHAALLISSLIEHSGEKELIISIIKQIVRAVTERELPDFRIQIQTIRFIPGYNCRTGKENFYSLGDIGYSSYFAFKDSQSSRDLARAFQRALAEKDVILVNRELAQRLCNHLRECDNSACFQVLHQCPNLSESKNRTDLLERLLP